MSYEDREKSNNNEFDNASQEYLDSLDILNNLDNEVIKDMQDAGSEYVDAVGDLNKAAEPAESISSRGYDPSLNSRNNELSNDKSINKNLNNNGVDKSLQRGNEREQAPDLGKDYGSKPSVDNGYDEVGNGYNPYDSNIPKENNDENTEDDKGKQDQYKQPTDENDTNNRDEKDEKDLEKDSLDKKDDEESKKEKESANNNEPKREEESVQNQESQLKDQKNETNQSLNYDEKDKNIKDEKKDKSDLQKKDSDNGNGYGALRKNQTKNGNDMSDPTARARRNLRHNNPKNENSSPKPKSKTGNNLSKSGNVSSASKKGVKGGSILKNSLNKLGNGLKNAGNKLGKGNKKDSKTSNPTDKFAGNLKNIIFSLMKKNPVLSAFIIFFVIIILIIAMEEISGTNNAGGRGKRSCTYELAGVTSSGTVELSNLKVEVINCDGKPDNYEVLTTVDFEKYILGVALAEAGPSSPDEALKAQMIAVRNFTLTRNSGMCPGNPSDCFYGYNESTGIIRMRACTNDQVFWDYTKDCPKIDRAGKPTLYCEGVDGSTDIWKSALSPERQKEVEALANEVMGKVLLDEHGNVLKLGYQVDETDKFIADANAGSTYDEILEGVYGSSNLDSSKCSYGGMYDYGDYTLSSDGSAVLHEPLDEFLEDNGTSLDEFNDLITDNVEKAGWGTRAGVVAAATTLIGELGDNYGVKVPYYWSGGHYDGVVDGALGYWGSTECHTTANGQQYNYCGLDCSGFVPWAIKNGGFKKGVDLAGNFLNMPSARKVTLNDKPQLQPGDLLESKKHVVLVVGVDEAAGQYICAEASGNSSGVLFTRRSFDEDGYWGVDLEDFYNDPNNVREPIQ